MNLFFRTIIKKSNRQSESVPFEKTTCGRDAFQRGSDQKVVGFTFFHNSDQQFESGRNFFAGIEENLKLMPIHYPGVNFINIICRAFAPIFLRQKITNPNCNQRKAAQSTFVKKIVRKMLMKLSPGVNFTNILHAFFCPYSFHKKLQSITVTREKLCNLLSCRKCAHKMLIKLTTGVNFINIIQAAFLTKVICEVFLY